MSGYLIDLFFSLKGRVGRRDWIVSTLVVAFLAVVGVWLFNDDGFDESLNAVSGAPTMAAFLWVALGLFVFTALSVKRLRDGASSAWLVHTLWIPGAIALIGWGLGAFSGPDVRADASLALPALAVIALPAIARCAVRPTSEAT
ncbi:DUF805 domain-containing protein [Hyphomicrobium sp. CS1GBMeth3]|uniref:DUF805 domain-containing protein n=1 Tax=Hyphomicrobium sp. CS1GBMeth3 TaxID=1892845 RepID=UPI0009310923|nr:DUF805 domain-containing protein [Hyphomicrobium sp. CS1GBMeth3]